MKAWTSLASVVFALAAGVTGTCRASTFTIVELQRLIQANPVRSMKFEELRESPWLPAPVVSRGTMRVTERALEKRVDSPRAEALRLLADRIEWTGPDGATKQVLFSQAPALAPLADVMRLAAAGDLESMQRDFRIELNGDARVWRAQLMPRGPEVARLIDQVELQGTAGRLQVIIVTERGGQRTTTRLLP